MFFGVFFAQKNIGEADVNNCYSWAMGLEIIFTLIQFSNFS